MTATFVLGAIGAVPETRGADGGGGRVWHVVAGAGGADRAPTGGEEAPFPSISAAMEHAVAGDTVLVGDGVYRETVRILRGGEPGRPLTLMAAPGARPAVRGTDVFAPEWTRMEQQGAVYYSAPLPESMFAGYGLPWAEAFQGPANPYRTKIMVSALGPKQSYGMVARPWPRTDGPAGDDAAAVVTFDTDTRKAVFDGPVDTLPKTLGQVYVDDEPLRQAASLDQMLLAARAFMVSADGRSLLLHLPEDARPQDHVIEITTRAQCLVPVKRGISHVVVRGLTFERAANQGPFPQAGMVSTRSGSHWLIEQCVIRNATTIGLDCGGETYTNGEGAGVAGGARRADGTIIRGCRISDNGLCGIAAISTKGIRIVGNLLERNSRIDFIPRINAAWWEFAAIKLHISPGAVIERNLIRDNEAFGIWIDTGFADSRITRNVILNNKYAGVFGEAAFGPLLVDNNIVAYTRSGHGIYMHDGSDVGVAHNLVFRNAGCGVFMRNVRPMDTKYETSRNTVFGNLLLGNQTAAVGLPLEDAKNRDNLSDWNVLSGGTQFLDHGPVEFLLHSRTRGFFKDGAFVARAGADLSEQAVSWKDEDLLRLNGARWSQISANDRHSISPFPADAPYIGLRSRELEFELTVSDELSALRLPASLPEGHQNVLEAGATDFYGRSISAGGRAPGPFGPLQPGRVAFPINPLEYLVP